MLIQAWQDLAVVVAVRIGRLVPGDGQRAAASVRSERGSAPSWTRSPAGAPGAGA
ncbi:hypothetical protein ABZ330_29600 [Streptomyces sp. NPDC006172]|uniref:hypothetical protein n=1 Tax=Streptomyces sp. NPDC006172 TaxID=3154470 RepID=UPI0033FE96B3